MTEELTLEDLKQERKEIKKIYKEIKKLHNDLFGGENEEGIRSGGEVEAFRGYLKKQQRPFLS